MKLSKIKTAGLICFAAIAVGALALSGAFLKKTSAFAESAGYNESYRNQLAYSAKSGWNNDPNGLLYVNGVYHMYYQYTWDQRSNTTKNGWDHMSWGHATSRDLVHWTEQPVAIPAYWDGENAEHMMFSGSAVYDEYNTSGLFETENGKVKDGQGIVAVLTQPNDKAGGQRQILAYSKDGGASFDIHGEVLGANAEGSLGDGEFRDPKVFWNGTLNKWLMAVGGGSVRMYSSDNLLNWEYLGETGLWGECPDISRYEVDGTEKYVLIISPEDKSKSHAYNGTNRVNTYYPAEYYTVGGLDGNGLFHAEQPIKRLSEGIDCYAFQSFNNVPDGKVYGISWSASWLTAGAYEGYRENYNGGMTVACELDLVRGENGFELLRKPVDGFTGLRKSEIAAVSGKIEAGNNPFEGIKATEADIELQLDFNKSPATYAELSLRASAEESIKIRYGVLNETLSLDRSQSSLIAENTNFFKSVYSKRVPLADGKLNLRILLDRAFISVFANGGAASFFSAVFPSAVSDGMSLKSDGEITVDAHIYAVESVFGEVNTKDEFIITTNKTDMVIGAEKAVIASSYADGFNAENVAFTVTEGAENVSLKTVGATAYITALKKGSAKIKASYGGNEKFIEVYVYGNGFKSNVNFTENYRAFSYLREDGLFLGAGATDAFIFGGACGRDFTYSANFTPQKNAQAGGLAFGYNGNASGFWFATADVKENKVKLVEFRGEKEAAETLAAADYSFTEGAAYRLTVAVKDGKASVSANGNELIVRELENYAGGRAGLNVFNSDMVVNGVYYSSQDYNNGIAVGSEEIVKIVNVTDGSYRLKDGEYAVEDGILEISESYLKTLEQNTEYVFRIVTAASDCDVAIKTGFTGVTLTPAKEEFAKDESFSFTVNGGTGVYKVEIDGSEYGFTVDGSVITVSAEALKNLTSGTHTVKVYTQDGRAAADFKVARLPDYREEAVEAVSHAFFWVDIAIFAALIIGYAVFTIVKKYGKKQGVKE